MNERKGEFLVGLALALRASSLLFGKIAMRTMGPYLTIAIRFSIAFVLIAFLFRKSLHKVNFRTLWHCALIGFFFFLAMVFEMFGLQTTPSSVTAFLEGSVVVNKVKEGKDSFGYNAKTDTYEDLIKAGVIDPAKVTRTALKNAASIASMILTTDCVITEKKEPKAPAAPAMDPSMGMGGMM